MTTLIKKKKQTAWLNVLGLLQVQNAAQHMTVLNDRQLALIALPLKSHQGGRVPALHFKGSQPKLLLDVLPHIVVKPGNRDMGKCKWLWQKYGTRAIGIWKKASGYHKKYGSRVKAWVCCSGVHRAFSKEKKTPFSWKTPQRRQQYTLHPGDTSHD